MILIDTNKHHFHELTASSLALPHTRTIEYFWSNPTGQTKIIPKAQIVSVSVQNKRWSNCPHCGTLVTDLMKSWLLLTGKIIATYFPKFRLN